MIRPMIYIELDQIDISDQLLNKKFKIAASSVLWYRPGLMYLSTLVCSVQSDCTVLGGNSEVYQYPLPYLFSCFFKGVPVPFSHLHLGPSILNNVNLIYFCLKIFFSHPSKYLTIFTSANQLLYFFKANVLCMNIIYYTS